MKNLFTELESQFERIDLKLNDLNATLSTNANALNLTDKIEKAYQKSHLIIKDIFNSKRFELINQLENTFKECIRNMHKLDLIFRNSTTCVSKITSTLLGHLKYENEFDILKRFQYLEFYNFFTELEIARDQIDSFDVKITALNRHKLFIYSKQKCFLKIVNEKCEELSSRTISNKFLFKSIICYDPRIATLFQDSTNKKFYLTIYDDDLNLISYKSFNVDLNLCSLNSKEVICWMRNIRKCIIYDHNLNELAQIGQDNDITKPFYFCDSVKNDGNLLEVSDKKILFYFSDENHHVIKIINRFTGSEDGKLNIPPEYVPKLIKFDSKSNIIMKKHTDGSLNLYNSIGEELMSRDATQFTNLIRFDIIRNDEIVCYDTNKDKLFYF